VPGNRVRRRKQLLEDLKEKRRYWNLKWKYWIVLCGESALEESMDITREATDCMSTQFVVRAFR
jgi:hypothetical protein